MIDKEKLFRLELYFKGVMDNLHYLKNECKVVPLKSYRLVKNEVKNCRKGITRLRKRILWIRKK